MAVTWPDGSVTGSVRVPVPAPAEIKQVAETQPEKKKEVEDADR